MNRKLVVVATVVIVGVLGVVMFRAVGRRTAPSNPPPVESSGHSNGMDHIMAARLALFHAPEGSTPCETAYNAFKASQDAATQENVPPVVLHLATRDEFLARCMALPTTAQPCMAPLYKSRHEAACAKETRPAPEVMSQMVQIKGGEPGAPQQEPSAPAP